MENKAEFQKSRLRFRSAFCTPSGDSSFYENGREYHFHHYDILPFKHKGDLVFIGDEGYFIYEDVFLMYFHLVCFCVNKQTSEPFIFILREAENGKWIIVRIKFKSDDAYREKDFLKYFNKITKVQYDKLMTQKRFDL